MIRSCVPTSTRAKKDRRPGAVVVEFALVVPLFVGFALGMIELSRGIMVKQILSDAARRACRAGTLAGSTNSTLTADIVTTLQDNNLNTNRVGITILINGQAGDVSSAQQHDKITVRVTLPYADVAWITPLFLQGNVESESLSMMRQL